MLCNTFVCVTARGGMYKAYLRNESGGARLQIVYVDMDGREHEEKDHTYKSEYSAMVAMRRYKKGAEWRRQN